MGTFSYVAVEPSGKKKTGLIDAANRDAAIASITSEGRFVLELKESHRELAKSPEHGRVTRQDLSLFTRRMADLAAAGLPLDRVLQVVAEQSESSRLAHVAELALEDVRAGMPVSDALGRYPKLFPTVFTQTLRAGEASGQFAEVATRLADFQEKEVARRSQIVSSLIYPSVLISMAIFVVIFMLTFVVPRLSGVFADLGDDLPAATKMLLTFTNILTTNYLTIIGVVVVGIVLFRGWAATEAGAVMRDASLLKMPIIGKVVMKAVISRYARVLGTLVFGGVPILESLRLSGLSCGNRLFQSRSDIVENEVREGRQIAEAMRDAQVFPPVLTHMVAIGEETGDLPKMLDRVANSLDFEVDVSIRRIVAFVEPFVILMMGVIVGFVVLAILLPIYQAQSLVK